MAVIHVTIAFIFCSCFHILYGRSFSEPTTKKTVPSKGSFDLQRAFSIRKGSFETCTSDEDCSDSRECYASVSTTEREKCDSSNSNTNSKICACFDYTRFFCFSNGTSKCLSGDRCVGPKGSEQGFCSACGKKLVDDIVELDDNGCTCIAVDHLKYLNPSSLVFPIHRRAFVLCDVHQNCATPAHMVIYQNKPMTMASYCEIVSGSCVRRIMLVNSPRMVLGLRVLSKTNDLQFTALAAAGQTRVEELFLKTMIAIGV